MSTNAGQATADSSAAAVTHQSVERRPRIPDVSALDVAVELVATKMALRDLLWDVTGTTVTVGGLDEWVMESPIPLPTDPESAAERIEPEIWQRISDRSDEIRLRMLAAAGHFLLGIYPTHMEKHAA